MRILLEDDHLLAVDKPSGLNTHRPDPFAPDGLHEWLLHRQPSWHTLSILHRLDKDTSGVIVFGKTRIANQSLSAQFETRQVTKQYRLLSASPPSQPVLRVRDEHGETEFTCAGRFGAWHLMEAQPLTGKTHQIRKHAAAQGFPVAGDSSYGGAPASRLMLHAHRIGFRHPVTAQPVLIESPMPKAFGSSDPLVAAREYRDLIFENEPTDAYRLVHGVGDGLSGIVVDNFAGHLLVQWQDEARAGWLDELRERYHPVSIWQQTMARSQRATASPAWPTPAPPPEKIVATENGLKFDIRFQEGSSPGLFLDQRENRRHLLGMNLTGQSVLNCFAYTCAFSVAAARAGAIVTSLDLSVRYLDWGRDNFRWNGIDPARHDFIYGDVLDWLKRFGKRGRQWDMILLDPPTFSTTKTGRVFRAGRDFGQLVELALPLIRPGGWLFCSTNQHTVSALDFAAMIKRNDRVSGEMVFRTQPVDFRACAEQPAYLKTVWARVS